MWQLNHGILLMWTFGRPIREKTENQPLAELNYLKKKLTRWYISSKNNMQ